MNLKEHNADARFIKRHVETLFSKYKMRAADRLVRGSYDSAAFYIERASVLMYSYNLMYKDDDLDEMVLLLAKMVGIKAQNIETDVKVGERTRVTIVDSFGFSYRGLAWIYAKGLIDLGYELQFVVPGTVSDSDAFRPLRTYLESSGASVVYAVGNSFTARAVQMVQEISVFSPSKLFFHGKPWDVAGLTAIAALSNSIDKYQINITDHAFWLGPKAFDYCIEFREYGAMVSVLRRGLSINQLALLPYYPVQAIASPSYAGLPFEEGDSFFISGGSAYKSEGRPEFAQMVEECLVRHRELKFLFLSNSEPSWFAGVRQKYSDRVFLQSEREDLAEVIKRSVFFLNTYPLYGGLMTQIAAICGKVPVTLLLEGCEPSAKLLSREVGQIDFDSVEAVLEEIDRLVDDEAYRHRREIEIMASMDGPDEFALGLSALLEGTLKAPLADCEFDDSKLVADYLSRGGFFGPARTIVCAESLKHMTLFDRETWYGIAAKLGQDAFALLSKMRSMSNAKPGGIK